MFICTFVLGGFWWEGKSSLWYSIFVGSRSPLFLIHLFQFFYPKVSSWWECKVHCSLLFFAICVSLYSLHEREMINLLWPSEQIDIRQLPGDLCFPRPSSTGPPHRVGDFIKVKMEGGRMWALGEERDVRPFGGKCQDLCVWKFVDLCMAMTTNRECSTWY